MIKGFEMTKINLCCVDIFLLAAAGGARAKSWGRQVCAWGGGGGVSSSHRLVCTVDPMFTELRRLVILAEGAAGGGDHDLRNPSPARNIVLNCIETQMVA
jgi:hypothetical protein